MGGRCFCPRRHAIPAWLGRRTAPRPRRRSAARGSITFHFAYCMETELAASILTGQYVTSYSIRGRIFAIEPQGKALCAAAGFDELAQRCRDRREPTGGEISV